jgi:hypothetical protein
MRKLPFELLFRPSSWLAISAIKELGMSIKPHAHSSFRRHQRAFNQFAKSNNHHLQNGSPISEILAMNLLNIALFLGLVASVFGAPISSEYPQ